MLLLTFATFKIDFAEKDEDQMLYRSLLDILSISDRSNLHKTGSL